MPTTNAKPRFRAHAAEVDRCRDHVIPDAADFLEAAVLFAERWGGEAGEMSIVVIDDISGDPQCFRIDLDTQQAEPC